MPGTMGRLSHPMMVVIGTSLALAHCAAPAEDPRPDPEVLRTHVEHIRTGGQLRVRPDVYERDGPILERLKGPFVGPRRPVLATPSPPTGEGDS